MPNHEIRNVLLLVDANPDLTAAAQMALVPGGSSPKPVIPPGLPRGFHYDSSFPPVPISEQGLLQVTMSAAAGRAEGGLVVRGQVRTSELEKSSPAVKNGCFRIHTLRLCRPHAPATRRLERLLTWRDFWTQRASTAAVWTATALLSPSWTAALISRT